MISGFLTVLAVCASCGTEQRYLPQELEAAKAELRAHIRLWTFEAGAILGRVWTGRAPQDAELRALYARQLHGHREIQEQADAILERDPDNPWGIYTQAVAFLADWKHSEAGRVQPARLEAAAPAGVRRDAPSGASVQKCGRGDGVSGLAGCSDTSASRGSPTPRGTRVPGKLRTGRPAYADTSLATMAMLRERWPDHVSGYFRAAEQLYRFNKPQEARALIEEAVRLSPGSADVRQLHWKILNKTDLLPAEERRTAIEASIAEVPEGRAGERTWPSYTRLDL